MSSSAKGSRVLRGAFTLLAWVFVLAGCDALTSPEQRLARVRTELASGQLGLAAMELRKLVRANPHNGPAWLLLAQLSLDVGDIGATQAALDHAKAAGSQGADFDTLRARAWLAAGQPQALIDALAHRELPGLAEPDRTIQLARAYNALRQPQRAEGLLAPLLQAHPSPADAQLTEADALALEGKSDQALEELNRLLTAQPHFWEAGAQRARLLEYRGQFAAAESAFGQALHDMPISARRTERVRALVGLTEARLVQGKIDLAAQSQALLAKMAPGTVATQLVTARLKLARGDTLGGVADLQGLVARAPAFVPAEMLLGSAELQRGNLGQAEQVLEQVVQQDPDNVQARELLATARLRLSQPDEALRALTPALSEQPADAQLMALLGAAETQEGNADSVFSELERALQARPQDRELRLNLAQAYLRAGRAPQALTLLEGTPETASDLRRESLLVAAVNAARGPAAATAEVEKLLSAHPRDLGRLDLAAAYFSSLGELGRAQALLHQALELNASDERTLVALAQVEASAGDLRAAESSARTALAADAQSVPVRILLADLLMQRKAFADAAGVLAPIGGAQAPPQVQFALARLALAQGKLLQANAALDRALAQRPKSAELANQAGALLMQSNQYDAALARFAQASELAPDNALYLFNAGRAQLARKALPAARESFEKAAKLQPQWLPPASALVLMDVQAKDYRSARARVDRLLSSHPHDASALALQGDVEWLAGQRTNAEAAYTQAQRQHATAAVAERLFRVRLEERQPNTEQPLVQWLAQRPDDRAVRTVLGSYYLSKGALKEAVGQFETLLEQVPTDVIALNDLAWCYGQLHDPRAELLAERAYQLAPTAPDVDDTLGWILVHEGKTEQALPLLAQAVKLNANDPELQYHYAYVLAQQGKRAEAHEILSKLLAGKGNFDSRRDAERLLADTKT